MASKMSNYIVSLETGVPICTICGRVIPDCGPNAINIDPVEVRFCYFCGSRMDRFYYPEGEDE